MAAPKTGSRRIVVDGIAYRWRIRRRATYDQMCFGIGTLHISVELDEKPGTVLVLDTRRPHPADLSTSRVIPVRPNDVATWVRQALQAGWRPAKPGPQFRMDSWAHQHRDELLGCGVPAVVFEREYNWRHFLRYGYFKPYDAAEPIIHVERMRQSKAERLRAFLESQHDDCYPASTALDRLRSRLSGGWQEETQFEEPEQPSQKTQVPS
jgi:hypothetical protein